MSEETAAGDVTVVEHPAPTFWQESGEPYWEAVPPIWQPSEEEYHNAEAIDLPSFGSEPVHGSTMLGTYLSNPALYHARYVTGEAPKQRRRPMIVGSMVDDQLLQPAAFERTYVRQPESVKLRKGGAWEDFLEDTLRTEVNAGSVQLSDEEWESWLVAAGAPDPKKPRNGKVADAEVRWGPDWLDFLEPRVRRTIVHTADWDLAMKIADRLRADEMAEALLLGDGYPQACHAWQDPHTGIWCKFRIDHATETRVKPAAVDLKVWNVVDPVSVAKRVWDFGTHRQLALYEEGFMDLWRVRPDNFLVIAHNEEPFEVAVYQLSPEFMAAGRRDIRRAREGIQASMDTGDWKNPWQGEICELLPPTWAMKQIAAEMGGGNR